MQPDQPDFPQQPEPNIPPRPQGYPSQTPAQPSWQTPQPQPSLHQPTHPDAQPTPFNSATHQPSYQNPVQPTLPTNHQTDSPYQHDYQPVAPKNKKKLLAIIAGAVVVVGVAAFLLFGGGKSIVNKIAGPELEKYTSTAFGFSIQIPKGWTPEEKNDEFFKEVTFNEPVGDIKDQSEANSHYASVRVNYEFADKDYLEKNEQEYFDAFKKGLQQALSRQDEEDQSDTSSDYAKEKATVEKEEMTTVNGLKAYKVKLKVTNYDSKKDAVGYQYGLFVFVDSKNQYEITLSAHESESVNSKADEILASFTKS